MLEPDPYRFLPGSGSGSWSISKFPWIRIRNNFFTSWIRIRIKMIRIRNTGEQGPFEVGSRLLKFLRIWLSAQYFFVIRLKCLIMTFKETKWEVQFRFQPKKPASGTLEESEVNLPQLKAEIWIQISKHIIIRSGFALFKQLPVSVPVHYTIFLRKIPVKKYLFFKQCDIIKKICFTKSFKNMRLENKFWIKMVKFLSVSCVDPVPVHMVLIQFESGFTTLVERVETTVISL